MHDLILGTAGHIDHGKTSLVRALTGVDCDRLPEEKRRGITIDLGFAELVLGEIRLGIVDVPGHERFVRNMLAGATGIDLALLVVAADDSVKQQTREHVDILRLLNLRAGVIALTKCDLCEPSWLELVEAEIRELTAGSFLEQAPLVRTSSTTGAGIDDLREALAAAAKHVAFEQGANVAGAPFRLAIDRAFTLAGHGAVVTGSVASGEARVGDSLVIEPGHLEVRVRALHNHERPVESVHAGQRAAVNLAGIRHEQIVRGHELATPGHLVPSQLFTVRLSLLPGLAHPLKNRSRVRVHLGTAEILAGVALLERDRLEPGETGFAQLLLAEPAVATWNQPFVVRSESPVATLGGGRVLSPCATRLRHLPAQALALLEDLGSADALRRAAAAIYFRGFEPWQPAFLATLAGIATPDATCAALRGSGQLVEIQLSPVRVQLVHVQALEELCERVAAHLEKLHAQHPLKLSFQELHVASAFAYLGEPALFTAAVAKLLAAGKIQRRAAGVALAGHGPKLSQGEQRLLEQLIERFRQAGFEPPGVKECQEEAAKNRAAVPQLLSLAVGNGDLAEIAADFYLHAEHVRHLRETVGARLAVEPGLTVSQIREMLNTSRKYAVPLCEYLDRIGFTRRQGDVRILAQP